MRKYEGLFIFPPDEAGEAGKELDKRLEETMTRFGGRILDRQDWGRRPLGYPLRKFREGHMLVWNFEMEGQKLAEFRRTLQLDEKILKITIVSTPKPKVVKESHKKPQPQKGLGTEGKEGIRVSQPQ